LLPLDFTKYLYQEKKKNQGLFARISGQKMKSNSLFIVVALLALIDGVTSAVNKDVQRTIDASSAILKIYIDIKAIEVEKEYQLIFPTDHAKNLAFLSVTQKGNNLAITAPVAIGNGNLTLYSVQVSDSSPSLKVEAIFTSMLEPYPAEITQNEGQLVRFTENHFFISPYKTETQKTTIKLASNGIESFTKLLPSSARGSTINYGPYKDILPYTISPATTHYSNNKPFAKLSTVNRELEVSHWGSISVEEIYELKHTGAKLQGG
jgi:oligosaccharyltransferase complex subunit alpha (ribophorin I)